MLHASHGEPECRVGRRPASGQAKVKHMTHLGHDADCSYRVDFGTECREPTDMLPLYVCIGTVESGDHYTGTSHSPGLDLGSGKHTGFSADHVKRKQLIRERARAPSFPRILTFQRSKHLVACCGSLPPQPPPTNRGTFPSFSVDQWRGAMAQDGRYQVRNLSRVTDGSLRQPSAAELVTAVGSRRRQEVWAVPLG